MKNLKESLDVHLEKETNTGDRFVIDSEDKANWALRKIAEHEGHLNNANELAQKEIDKIENWFKQIKEQKQNQIEHLQSMLAEYAIKQREKDPKFKSLKLPNGRFGFRKRPDKWNYDDEKLLESLKQSEMTDLIKVEEKVNKRDLRKVLEVVNGKVLNPETGEFIDGVSIEEQGESFNVAVEK